MLIVVGIIATLSAVVMFQYSSFDSQVLLRNLAYEIALSLREAQIYGVSVRGDSSGGFNTQYGVHFASTNAENTTFRLFRDNNSDGTYIEADDTLLQAVTIGRRNFIKKLCVDVGGTMECTKSAMSVFFKRPFSDANFWAQNMGDTSGGIVTPSSVHIVVGSKINDASERTVVVTRTGQIFVE